MSGAFFIFTHLYVHGTNANQLIHTMLWGGVVIRGGHIKRFQPPPLINSSGMYHNSWIFFLFCYPFLYEKTFFQNPKNFVILVDFYFDILESNLILESTLIIPKHNHLKAGGGLLCTLHDRTPVSSCS